MRYSFVEGTSAVSDIVVGISAVVVAVVAVQGLQAWRAQMTGRGQYDAARRVVVAAMRTDTTIQEARLPLSRLTENAGRVKDDNESPGQALAQDLRHRYVLRLRPVSDCLQELREAAWDCEALLPSKAIEEVRHCRTTLEQSYDQLTTDIQAYCDELFEQASNPMYRPKQDWLFELKASLEAGVDDSFGPSVARAVADLQSRLAPFLR
jgi:peptidoglycan hydrolase-like protein with peptidoglycan-binding domain